MSGAIIGGLHEYGLTYMQTPGAGVRSTRRVYDAAEFGWTLVHSVPIEYTCRKQDLKAALDALTDAPSTLLTVAGRNDDGSDASLTDWGGGYTLRDVSARSDSPSMAVFTADYKKEEAAAATRYPAGLTIACAAGVYTLAWQGSTYRQFDTGEGVCGADGFQFVKLPRERRDFLVTYLDTGVYYQRTQRRWYKVLGIECDGFAQERAYALEDQEWITDQEVGGSAASDVEVEDETKRVYYSDDYPAQLDWTADGMILRLVWCGQVVWQFTEDS